VIDNNLISIDLLYIFDSVEEIEFVMFG
jgi:hypothetical protein